MHRLAAEPEARPVRAPGLRLEVDVLVGVVLAGERGGRVAPEPLPRGELLVEQGAAPAERDAERLVLVPVPADGRLHDEAALGEQVERAELAREQQRVPQRRDHGAGGEPQAGRHGGDRREEDERARPRHRRILVPRHRVVARVAHDPVRPRRSGRGRCARSPSRRRTLPPRRRRPSRRGRAGRAAASASSSRSARGRASARSAGHPADEGRGRVDRRPLVRPRAPGPAPRPGRRTDRRSPPRGPRAPRSPRGRRTGRARPSSRPRARRRGDRRRAAPQRRAAAPSSRRTRRPAAASARAGRAHRRRSRRRSRSAPARTPRAPGRRRGRARRDRHRCPSPRAAAR